MERVNARKLKLKLNRKRKSEEPILVQTPIFPDSIASEIASTSVVASGNGQDQDIILGQVVPIADRDCQEAEASQPVSTPQPSLTIKKRSWIRRSMSWLARVIQSIFETLSLFTMLAVMTAVPLIQLISFGYLLDVAGKLTNGAKVSEAVRWRAAAGRIGLAVLALILLGLPIRLLTHWATVAEVISPDTNQVGLLRGGAVALTLVVMLHLSWAWARGGRLKHYFWPAPSLWLSQAWRPGTWLRAADGLIAIIRSFEIPRLFWLGARGAIGTLIWLLPATVIIAVNRNGKTGVAGLVGGIAFVCLGIALMYLPMLQANFAADNRLRSMFAVRRVRSDFRRAPWSWLVAMLLTLVVLPIPLYLLKIEPPPPELIWLPTWFFIAFMLPARIACGLAMRRARSKAARSKAEPSGKWAWFSRWTVRFLIPPVVGVYLLFVYLSQYVSWDGLQTWVQQHAVLVPVPFVGG